jgi:hypothetical protein
MGECWYFVDPARREYFDPGSMRWTGKMRGVVDGPPALALSLLVCASSTGGREADAVGRWHGDAVYFAGEYDGPDLWGVFTQSPRDEFRPLHFMAREEFTDVSELALTMLDDHLRTPPGGGRCLVVNPANRQYLRPDAMLRPDWPGGVLGGPAALAVGLLVCMARSWEGRDLASAWHCDAVFITAEGDPEHTRAEHEFTDITHRALAALAGHIPGIADEWAAQAATHDRHLADLGYAAIVTRDKVLTDALERRFDRGWTKRCEKAFRTHFDHLH